METFWILKTKHFLYFLCEKDGSQFCLKALLKMLDVLLIFGIKKSCVKEMINFKNAKDILAA